MKIFKAVYEKKEDRYALLKTLTFPKKKFLLIGYLYFVSPYWVLINPDTHTPTNVFPNLSWLKIYILENYKSELEIIK